MTKIIIYTAIFGDFDKLESPLVVEKGIKYLYFTDKKFNSDIWKVIIVKRKFKDPRKENRKYKILSHETLKNYDYDISIYIDGNITIKKKINGLVEDWLGNNNITVIKHPWRDCVYKEAMFCIKHKNPQSKELREQIEYYKKENYPNNNGLVWNGFMVRRNNEIIKKLNEEWWKQLNKFSLRDQVSFPYVMNKLGLGYSLINEGFPWKNKNSSQLVNRRAHK